MKKIFLSIAICLSSFSYLQAQLDDCPEIIGGLILGGTIEGGITPPDYTVDIWGHPVLDAGADRMIIWVHGLNGQGDDAGDLTVSWSQASLYTDLTYRADSRRPDYGDVSLYFAADELKGDIEEYEDANTTSILIAHSQGSIVSRQVDYFYGTGGLGTEPRTFGGLVTFGGPHQGARILNNKEDLKNWIIPTCDALTDGPIAEAIADNFFLNLFLDNTVAKDTFKTFFCTNIIGNIAPFVYKNFESGISESYEVGAEPLAILNDYTPTIPYVAFYGIETEPVMWNTLVHLLPDHEPNNDIIYGSFGANNDGALAAWADVTRNKYFLKSIEYDMLYRHEKAFPTLNPFDISAAAYLDIRDGFIEGYEWFLNANACWKSIIGADEYIVGEDWTCVCLNEVDFDLTPTYHTVAPGDECNELWGDCTLLINYDVLTKENDGIVLAESASVVKGMVPSESSLRMEDSNHFSMRNDHNTKDKLDELFQGSHGVFFTTPTR